MICVHARAITAVINSIFPLANVNVQTVLTLRLFMYILQLDLLKTVTVLQKLKATTKDTLFHTRHVTRTRAPLAGQRDSVGEGSSRRDQTECRSVSVLERLLCLLM